MTIFDMVKDSPAFKRFAAPHVCKPIKKAGKFKPKKISIPGRKGMITVLGEYSTGRLIKTEYGTTEELLTLRRVYSGPDGGYIVRSTDPDPAAAAAPQGVADYFTRGPAPKDGDLICPNCSRVLKPIAFVDRGFACETCKESFFIPESEAEKYAANY